MNTQISLKLTHGLGNVICLIPVIKHLQGINYQVKLITNREWIPALSAILPGIILANQPEESYLDLDILTRDTIPNAHIIQTYCRALGIPQMVRMERITVPSEWHEAYSSTSSYTVFAPEARHPSRAWPLEYTNHLIDLLAQKTKLIVVGTGMPSKRNDVHDLRGQLCLKSLMGILATARSLICMDSGILHLAALVGLPALAIFGGVDSAYRVHKCHDVYVLQANIDCCPCNKKEVCNGIYRCIMSITPRMVFDQFISKNLL